MSNLKYAGLCLLFILWLWLAKAIITAGGFNLKNLLLIAMSGVIVFVPIYKKYIRTPKS